MELDNHEPPIRGGDETAAIGTVGKYKTKASDMPILTAVIIQLLIANNCRHNKEIVVLEVKHRGAKKHSCTKSFLKYDGVNHQIGTFH